LELLTDAEEFHRLVQKRTDLIEDLMGVCDRAAHFAAELEGFSPRARNRAAVEKMLQEAVTVRRACEEALEHLQRQPAPVTDDPPADSAAPHARERKRPDYLRVVGQDDPDTAPPER
jgi:hypothetical protein